jgi:hypothetical protein
VALSTSEPKYTISEIITKGKKTTGLWIEHHKTHNLYSDQLIRSQEKEDIVLFFVGMQEVRCKEISTFFYRGHTVSTTWPILAHQLQDPAPSTDDSPLTTGHNPFP